MSASKKHALPLTEIRRYLEPGPIVLVSSHWQDQSNIMTMGWHMMLGFSPALFACYIWNGNHSFEAIRQSGECVINLPTADMVNTVVGIGNCTGADVDKFKRFGLTAQKAAIVGAPLITECHANFECKLVDDRQIDEYGMFIWQVVKAHVAKSPKRPQTLHYRGQAEFMVSGNHVSRRSMFQPQNL
ncbi:flavin reductase family protein [Xanthomonas campestris]|uniref:flavin reductase family protein n=1 Tax=Xanthomonas TaxID=338 RepID=UPI001E48528E|nr:flavin reductase family protein [Xanthomonas campestris]MCC5090470.1 flavin reductase family protein [Xanthomonas campestris]